MNRVIIADDEPLLRFHLQKTLEDLWPEIDILAQAANGDEAVALISELQPDVAFLDIHMPGLSGLEVALHISTTSPNTQIVFLTAFDEYAIDAFERGAIDYLLKPLDDQRLQKTLARLQRQSPATEAPSADLQQLIELVQLQSPNNQLTWLNAQHGDAIKVIHVDQILFLRAEDKYTTLVCAHGEYLLRMSIKQLEQQLNPEQFWRIHRSTLVNMRHVDRIEKTFSGRLQLYIQGHNKPLEVSRAKQHLFRAN